MDPDDYAEVGWYHVVEARRLLRDLEKGGVRFVIRSEISDPLRGDVISASHGGGFGAGGQVLLFVHGDDIQTFREIHDRDFLRDAPADDGIGIKASTIIKVLVIVGIGVLLGQLIANSLQPEEPQETEIHTAE
ncbi:hypothetical protein ACFQY0_06570 [Haloferula chungangensis]|uniref:Uncharacterized protein n=1 Tax=Haloferula chungangensis TaxID=1048331 RepID=A0ABW2L554_9BACT